MIVQVCQYRCAAVQVFGRACILAFSVVCAFCFWKGGEEKKRERVGALYVGNKRPCACECACVCQWVGNGRQEGSCKRQYVYMFMCVHVQCIRLLHVCCSVVGLGIKRERGSAYYICGTYGCVCKCVASHRPPQPQNVLVASGLPISVVRRLL